MDDLTKISGIGEATAAKLAAGGIDTFAKLAASSHDQLELLKIPGNAEGHQKLITAAAELAPKPIDLNIATAEQIAAQAGKIEAARLQLSQVADAVVMAYGQLQALSIDAAPEQVSAAEQALADARSLVDAATADARALFGVPDGAQLPPALLEELAPLENLPPIVRSPAAPHQADAADQQLGNDLGAIADQASMAADGIFDMPDLHGEAQGVLEDIIAHARAAAAAGDLAEAGEYLRQQRTDIRAAQVQLAEMLAGINAEIESLDQIQVTAPVEYAVEVTAKVASRWRIGRQFTKEATIFEAGELAADELAALKADPTLIVAAVH